MSVLEWQITARCLFLTLLVVVVCFAVSETTVKEVHFHILQPCSLYTLQLFVIKPASSGSKKKETAINKKVFLCEACTHVIDTCNNRASKESILHQLWSVVSGLACRILNVFSFLSAPWWLTADFSVGHAHLLRMSKEISLSFHPVTNIRTAG